MVSINKLAPEFTVKAFYKNDVHTLSLKDYRGKWVVLFFYPGDFTFVCPTELGELADHYAKFQEMGVEILSVSTDSVFVHKAWHDDSAMVRKVQFPMLADTTGRISKAYGTYLEDEGVSLRGTFLIDPDGILKAFEVHDNSIGRSVTEFIRKIEAARHIREHGEQACPANWKPGNATLKPGLDLVGKI